MTHGYKYPSIPEKTSLKQLCPSTKPFKEARCRECRIWEPPVDLESVPRMPCAHRRNSNPTENRFSILAHLDQQSNQTKWAFDFVAPPKPIPARRRGKRGGRNARSKVERSGRHDVFGEFFANLPSAAPRQDSHAADKAVLVSQRQHDFESQRQLGTEGKTEGSPSLMATLGHPAAFSTVSAVGRKDGVDASLPEPIQGRLMQNDIAQAEMSTPDYKRKESGIHRHSVFLNALEMNTPSKPSPVAQIPDRAKPPVHSKLPVPFKPRPPVAIPNIFQQKAAASAATAAWRALASQKAASPPLTITWPPKSNSPVLSSSPLAITPPLASSPELIRSPARSPFGSLTSSSQLSISPPLSLPHTSSPIPPPRPIPSPFVPFAGHWNPALRPSSSPTPDLPSPPNSAPTIKRSPPPQVPPRPRPIITTPQPDISTKSTDASLPRFLSMGHANPCWCRDEASPTFHSPAASSTQSIAHSTDPSLSDPASTFERIAPEESDEEGWTVVLPTSRIGKPPRPQPNTASRNSQQPHKDTQTLDAQCWDCVGQLVAKEQRGLLIEEDLRVTQPRGRTLESKGQEMAKEQGGCGIGLAVSGGTDNVMLEDWNEGQCETCERWSCLCEWPSLTEAAELKALGVQGEKKNTA